MSGERLLVFGLGYSGAAIAGAAVSAGFEASGTSRNGAAQGPDGVTRIAFADAAGAVAQATHLLCTAPPGEAGDPALAHYGAVIASAPHLRWIGYLSTTGVYGDRDGAWVDENTPPAPASPRSLRRLEAEQAWGRLACRCAVDIFRLAGIYGPGRSALDDLRAGRARRIVKPGHAFGRIHRDDIVRAVLAAMRQERAADARILNVADNEPAESAEVVAEAARLLGIAPPDAIPVAQVLPTLSPMARSFWAENRKVCGQWTQQALGICWRYPTYREGLRAILAEERGERPA
jgi:nucleoside-diphosphate-sugar epimerase